MSEIKDGGPAFPVIPPDSHKYRECPAEAGMSLRDYFAGQALTGYIASYSGPGCAVPEDQRAAIAAYDYADAMLKAREEVR